MLVLWLHHGMDGMSATVSTPPVQGHRWSTQPNQPATSFFPPSYNQSGLWIAGSLSHVWSQSHSHQASSRFTALAALSWSYLLSHSLADVILRWSKKKKGSRKVKTWVETVQCDADKEESDSITQGLDRHGQFTIFTLASPGFITVYTTQGPGPCTLAFSPLCLPKHVP